MTKIVEAFKFIEDLEAGIEQPADLIIDFSSGKIFTKSLQTVADALSNGGCPPGVQLDFSYNEISDENIQIITNALLTGKCPPGLRLRFYCCNISDAGTQFIANALSSGQCPTDFQINLSHTDIYPEGAKAITKALFTGNCPQNLKIDLPPQLVTSITFLKEQAAYNQTNFIIWFALQTGRMQEDCILSLLPLEMLEKILCRVPGFRQILPKNPERYEAKQIVISAKAFVATCQKKALKLDLVENLEKASEKENIFQQADAAEDAIEKFRRTSSTGENKDIRTLLVRFHLLRAETSTPAPSVSGPITMENPHGTNIEPHL